MSGANFSRIKNWSTGDVLKAADLNGEFNNILTNLNPAGIDGQSDTLSGMRATSNPYSGGTPNLSTSLAMEIQQLRYMLTSITGEAYWYLPATSLGYASLNAAITQIGGTPTRLFISSNLNLTANATVPATLQIEMAANGSITQTGSFSLNINGPFSAGSYQAFSGFSAGQIVFGVNAARELDAAWWGQKGDGSTADNVPIQCAIDSAAAMLISAFPPLGATTLVRVHGAARLTDSLYLYPGITFAGHGGLAFTVEATRLIMDTVGGTVNLTKNIINLTRTYNGTLVNNNFCAAIEDIGFWITHPGSTIATMNAGSGWSTVAGGGADSNLDIGGGTNLPSVVTSAAIHSAEATVDLRIRRCNFYQMPYAIFFDGSPTIDFEYSQCEFDTSIVALRVNGGGINIRDYNNLYYTGCWNHYIDGGVTGPLHSTGNRIENSKASHIYGTSYAAPINLTWDNHSDTGTTLDLAYVRPTVGHFIPGVTASFANGATVTIFTGIAGQAYRVDVLGVAAQGNAQIMGSWLVTMGGSNAGVMALGTPVEVACSMSSYSIQLTQSSGVSLALNWAITRVQ